MGAVAGLLAAAGHEVRGSDSAVYPPMNEQLAALHVPVMMPYGAHNLDWGPDVVVVGNVHTKDHVEVIAAQERGIRLTSFPAAISEYLLPGKTSIVVAGTHGKTTTTSLLAHILEQGGRDPNLLVGGVPIGLGQGFRTGSGPFVIEGDEYDTAFFDKGSKFLHYKPTVAILTSIELDHVDIFGSLDAVRDTFRKFVALIPPAEAGGLLVANSASPDVAALAETAQCKVELYCVLDGAGDHDAVDARRRRDIAWIATNLEIRKSGRVAFDIYHYGDRLERFETLLVGRHNVGNCLAAIAVAFAEGVSVKDIARGVASFAGVRRRLELRGIAGGVTVLDDYAHHPTAVRETLMALRQRFPKRRIIAVYEPRSATSRRNTFQAEFADAFSQADEVVIGPMFDPSKIPVDERFSPETLAHDLHSEGTKASHIPVTADIVNHVAHSAAPGDVVCVFSSGSFDGFHDKLLDAIGDAMRPARRADMASVRSLHAAVGLRDEPARDDQFPSFYVLHNEHGNVGCVALEVYGDDAIFRGLAVNPESRGAGYGWMLADMAVSQARWRGVRRIYLLTEWASDFFAAKFGFRIVDRSTVSKQIDATETFAAASPGRVAMRLDL